MGSPETTKFLLVDDLQENLLALEALLARDGLQLFRATSGQEALELLLEHDFALALLDVQMPEMNGFELAELMRGTERTRRIPIIFLTAVATDDGRRFRGYEAGAVSYLFKPVDPQMLKNKAEIFFELSRQKQELAHQRDELRVAAQQLESALERLQAHQDNSPLAVIEFDSQFRLIGWSNGAKRIFGWSASEVLGKGTGDFRWICETDQAAFKALTADMAAGNQRRNVHVARTYRKDGPIIECEWYNSVLSDASGNLISVNSQILDITERRRAEETQNLLIGELNHRVKNTLATVQAIASQTLRHTGEPAEFSTNFSGRIQALARAHSLLSNTTWRGANLNELMQDQLQLGAADPTRLAMSGPEIHLTPQVALALAMIFHELVTNAAKYGALSTQQGRIEVNWTVESGFLRLIWLESGGRPVKAPNRRGFGSSLIERSVQAEGGSAHVSYRADGILWELKIAVTADTRPEVQPTFAGDKFLPAIPTAPTVYPSTLKLSGSCFLIVEDETLVAMELSMILEEAGAKIVGPASTAEQAMQFIDCATFDAALLDGNLVGRPVDDIAAALTKRNIPFVFVSGYGKENLPRAFRHADLIGKPFTPVEVLEAAVHLVPMQAKVIQLRQ